MKYLGITPFSEEIAKKEAVKDFYAIPEEKRKGTKVVFRIPRSGETYESEVLNWGWCGYTFGEERIFVRFDGFRGMYVHPQNILSVG